METQKPGGQTAEANPFLQVFSRAAKCFLLKFLPGIFIPEILWQVLMELVQPFGKFGMRFMALQEFWF